MASKIRHGKRDGDSNPDRITNGSQNYVIFIFAALFKSFPNSNLVLKLGRVDLLLFFKQLILKLETFMPSSGFLYKPLTTSL